MNSPFDIRDDALAPTRAMAAEADPFERLYVSEWKLTHAGVGRTDDALVLTLSNGATKVVLCEKRAELEKLVAGGDDAFASSGEGRVLFAVDRSKDTIDFTWDEADDASLVTQEAGAESFVRAVARGLRETRP